ncbi:hypothetical protein MKEN_00566400 [Mycena kentingensis (nom. inval.)]|nr:hypothetical protein MKEN_00566400 [Mycena kentingensis (nom. inval.)]
MSNEDAGNRGAEVHTGGGVRYDIPYRGDEREPASYDARYQSCHPFYSSPRTFLTTDADDHDHKSAIVSPGSRFAESSLRYVAARLLEIDPVLTDAACRSTIAEDWGTVPQPEEGAGERCDEEDCFCNPESASSVSGVSSDYWSEPSPFCEMRYVLRAPCPPGAAIDATPTRRNIDVEYVAPNASQYALAFDHDGVGDANEGQRGGALSREEYAPLPSYDETVERLARLQRCEDWHEYGDTTHAPYPSSAVAAGEYEYAESRSAPPIPTMSDDIHSGVETYARYAFRGDASTSTQIAEVFYPPPSRAPQPPQRRVRPTMTDLLLPENAVTELAPSPPQTLSRQTKPKGSNTKSGTIASAASSRKTSSTRHHGDAKSLALGTEQRPSSVAVIKPGNTKGARTEQQRIDHLKGEYWLRQFGVVHAVCAACGAVRSLDRRSEFYPEGWARHLKGCKEIATRLKNGFVVPANFERRWVEVENDPIDRTFVWQLEDGPADKIPGAEPPLDKKKPTQKATASTSTRPSKSTREARSRSG